jgi:hypothetical protein
MVGNLGFLLFLGRHCLGLRSPPGPASASESRMSPGAIDCSFGGARGGIARARPLMTGLNLNGVESVTQDAAMVAKVPCNLTPRHPPSQV